MSFAFIESILAGDEREPGLDQVYIGLNKPDGGLKRVWVDESVHEPESVWGEDSVQLGQVVPFACGGNTVKTPDI